MKWVVFFLAVFHLISIADAAEIMARPKNKRGLYLGTFAIEGNIEKGDYEKFDKLVRRYGHGYNNVTIASKGGDLLEAMKIGRLIRKLRFSTNAPIDFGAFIMSFDVKDRGNDVCASACFFIYVAGVLRRGNLIGIHRPFLRPEDYKRIGADDAFAIHKKLKQMVAQYLEEMSVPMTYTDRLFSIPKEETEWLKEKEIDKTFSGWVPDLEEWIKAQCPAFTEIENITRKEFDNKNRNKWTKSDKQIFRAIIKREGEIFDCQHNFHKKLSCDAWEEHYWAGSVTIERFGSPCDRTE